MATLSSFLRVIVSPRQADTQPGKKDAFAILQFALLAASPSMYTELTVPGCCLLGIIAVYIRYTPVSITVHKFKMGIEY